MTSTPPSPQAILQLGLGFWAAKTLLSAVELGLFTELASGPKTGEQLCARLGLHKRGARDFLDALVSLHMLERTEDRYANTPETDMFLDRAKPSYAGGILEMANARLYRFWGELSEALRTGLPQNEAKHGGDDLFATLYADPDRLRKFIEAMTGVSGGLARVIAAAFPWHSVGSFVDVGCAQGGATVAIASAHPHLTAIGFDLPPVRPVFEEYVHGHGLDARVRFQPGDFFADPLPAADVVVMGHVLHDWDLANKRALIGRAHAALAKGGMLLVYDAVIDNDRRDNTFGLLMSLNMLVETLAGFDYTGADCTGWMRDAGFSEMRVEKLTGTHSMVIGTK